MTDIGCEFSPKSSELLDVLLDDCVQSSELLDVLLDDCVQNSELLDVLLDDCVQNSELLDVLLDDCVQSSVARVHSCPRSTARCHTGLRRTLTLTRSSTATPSLHSPRRKRMTTKCLHQTAMAVCLQ